MVSIRPDPVLMAVGIILVIAIIAGIGASLITSEKPSQKAVKYTSTGKAALESPCCKDQGSFSSGCGAKSGECQKGCNEGQRGCSGNCPALCRNK